MNQSARVRFGTEDDFEAVVRLEHLEDHAAYRHCLEQRRYFLLDQGDAIVGLARLDRFLDSVPYLGYNFIETDARGRGYSRLLLEAVIEQARALNQPRLFSSSDANEPTPQAWHRHVGFRDAGTIRDLNDYGGDEVFFCLDL
ncbi:MAG: GNAT family N-acetyltransferase [Planctomycetota bacterium]